jgi:preprotein translocase subunit SecA
VSYSGGSGAVQPSALTAAAAGGAGLAEAEGYAGAGEDEAPLPPVEQRRLDDDEQLGRNDPCWCGSGKKFKRCHGA